MGFVSRFRRGDSPVLGQVGGAACRQRDGTARNRKNHIQNIFPFQKTHNCFCFCFGWPVEPPPPGVGQLCRTLGRYQARGKLRTPLRPIAGAVSPDPLLTRWGDPSAIFAEQPRYVTPDLSMLHEGKPVS